MIRLDNIHKAFGSKQVLTGFTLEVREGDIAVILGYSGTGKSVAIKHIVGLLEPDQGTVWVDGMEVPKLSRRELYALRGRIGYVFQFAALFDSLTVGENVAMGLRKQGQLTEDEIQARVHEALQLVDLPDAAERRAILDLQLKRRRPEHRLPLEVVVDRTAGFSGAELEQVVIEAMHQAFSEIGRAHV